MKKIVVLGSTNTDMVIAGKKIPVPGETISGGMFLMNPGGKGANQAVAAALLMQLETPLETVLAAAKWVVAKGVPVILNPAPAAKLPKDLYRCLEWITPNEMEAELLTRVKVTDEKSAKNAAAISVTHPGAQSSVPFRKEVK